MTRSLPEWRGKTPDERPPKRVRLRIFEAHGGICHISGRKIGPADVWELDHRVALVNGGLNVESNLAPALVDKHREKTKADVAIKAKTAAVRARHLGLKPNGPKIQNRGFVKVLKPDKPAPKAAQVRALREWRHG